MDIGTKVRGRGVSITNISASDDPDKFEVEIEFTPGPIWTPTKSENVAGFILTIPSGDYNKAGLFGVIARKTRRRVREWIKEKSQKKEREKEHQRIEELAKRLKVEIGLNSPGNS